MSEVDETPTPRETPSSKKMKAVTPCEELLALMKQLNDDEVGELNRHARLMLRGRMG